ncbi:MAG: hypothetical protein JSU92_00640 [Deltaproteobacteria bacterium]|nr:MAG: hypothetical protein JSU92_00640 [Deltaproteobacteria bacterium]
METGIREIFEAFQGITFTVLMWWVTISIFRRYRVTKYLPALVVGVGFFTLGFIFAPILALGRTLMVERPEIAGLVGPGASLWYSLLSIVCGNAFVIGLFLFGVFTRQVFRPGSPGSLFFLIFIGIILIGSSDLIFMFEDIPISISWGACLEIKIVFTIGGALNFGWLAYESLSRWSIYRRQLKEGKDLDPLVVNRFLLWGLAGMSYIIAGIGGLFFEPYKAIQPLIPALTVNTCIFTFAIFSYLSWSPPGWFKRIISKEMADQT